MPSIQTVTETYQEGEMALCAKTGELFKIKFITLADNTRDFIGNTSGISGNKYLYYDGVWAKKVHCKGAQLTPSAICYINKNKSKFFV